MLMQILKSPASRMTFGKFQGIRWRNLPESYRIWVISRGVVARSYSFPKLRSKLVRVWY